MYTRPKKTIVVKTVERRSPEGKLLSTTKSKTVYLEEKPISEILPQTKTQFVYVSPVDEQLLGVDHENNFVNRPVIVPTTLNRLEKDLDEIGRHAPPPSATIYNYKWEPKRILPCSQILMSNDLDDDGVSSERTKYIDAHYVGNNTLHGGDDCSSSSGTCLKQSKLMRQSDFVGECRGRKPPHFSYCTTPINQWLQKLHSSHK